MSLQERVYSVLIVSAAEGFGSAMADLLPEAKFHPVHTVNCLSSAKRTVAERNFDFVIINAPLPDGFGSRFAIDASASKSTAVLLMVRNDVHEEIFDKVAEHGVFTLPKPTSKNAMATALNWLTSAREMLRKQETKTLSIEEKMAEIRLVNRAKWLLIDEKKMSEPDAHRYIEKQAMDRCVSKREIAEEIIKTHANTTSNL